jgi:hypothetical protein
MLATMARGWESKAVESQQADREAAGRVAPAPSADALARRQRAETVALALADASAQLQAACRPAHREALQHRVSALRGLLADLQAPEERPAE